MAEHLSDEEQIEALKRWFKANGTRLLLALVLVLGSWYAWQHMQDREKAAAEEAALLYGAMLEQLAAWENAPSDKSATAAASHAETLKSLSPKSQYGRYAALVLAKLAVADGDFDTAAAELQWVRDNAGDEALKHLAALRLARVEVARGNDEQALSLLDTPAPAPLTALYAELKGDIHARLGDSDAARQAYQVALENLDTADAAARPLLELKLNQIAPAATVNPGASEEDA